MGLLQNYLISDGRIRWQLAAYVLAPLLAVAMLRLRLALRARTRFAHRLQPILCLVYFVTAPRLHSNPLASH